MTRPRFFAVMPPLARVLCLLLVSMSTILLVAAGDKSQDSPVPILGYMSSADRINLKAYFNQNTVDSLDASRAYYVAKGLNAVGDNSFGRSLCSALIVPLSTPEMAFYHSSGLKLISSADCKISTKEIKDLASQKLNENAQIEDLFYMVMAMHDSGLSVDSSAVAKLVAKIKSRESSVPTSVALMCQIVARLNLSKSELLPYMDMVSNILDFADELNGKQLFFEKGLYTTALVAEGISDLISVYGSVGDIPEQKLVKLINFMKERLHSNNLRAAAHLASALNAFFKNQYLAPVILESQMGAGAAGEINKQQPSVELRLKDLLGESSFGSNIVLKAGGLYALHNWNGEGVLVGPAERGKFIVDGSSVYRLSLGEPLPSPGRYELEVSGDWAKSDRKKLLGITRVKLPIRVSTEVKVIEPKLMLMDSSTERHLADIQLNYGQLYKGSASDGVINLELHHQMTVSMRLVDANDASLPLTAHQMFLQLTHLQTQQTITFTFSVFDANGTVKVQVYRATLNPEQSAADFDYLDGIYKMELIMGDSYLRNPSIWHMANVQLHFEGDAGADSARRVAQATDVSRQRSPSPAAMRRASGPNPLIGTGPTRAKPEIEHIFRAPEMRAPRPLAWAFTIACAVPLLVLLIVWSIIGVNVWNFRFGLSNLIFHLGLLGIFCLYLLYWLRLNMFTTLGYLAVLGVPTFLAGNTVLRTHLSSRLVAVGAKK